MVDAPEHEPAPAHITSTDKLSREQEPLAKDGQQHVDVLRAGDAAQQNRFAAPAEGLRERLGIPLERRPERARRVVYTDCGEGGQVVKGDPRRRREEPAPAGAPAG